MHDVTKSFMDKRPIESKRSVNFNVTGYKTLVHMVSDFILQLAMEKLPFVKLGCIIKEVP